MSASGVRRHLLAAPTNPGASSSVVVYDTLTTDLTQAVLQRSWDRCRIGMYVSAADAVLTVKWADSNTGTLRTVLQVTVSASTYTTRDFLLQPGRTQISIVTTTNNSTWQVAAELIPDQALAQ